MEITGLIKITLYENKGIAFVFPDISKIDEVNGISSTGTIDIIDICYDVKFSRKTKKQNNNKALKSDNLEFYIQDLTADNLSIIQRLQTSRVGYIAKLEFLSDETLILQTPFFFSKTMKEFDSNSFVLSANYRLQSLEIDFLLVEGPA